MSGNWRPLSFWSLGVSKQGCFCEGFLVDHFFSNSRLEISHDGSMGLVYLPTLMA